VLSIRRTIKRYSQLSSRSAGLARLALAGAAFRRVFVGAGADAAALEGFGGVVCPALKFRASLSLAGLRCAPLPGVEPLVSTRPSDPIEGEGRGQPPLSYLNKRHSLSSETQIVRLISGIHPALFLDVISFRFVRPPSGVPVGALRKRKTKDLFDLRKRHVQSLASAPEQVVAECVVLAHGYCPGQPGFSALGFQSRLTRKRSRAAVAMMPTRTTMA